MDKLMRFFFVIGLGGGAILVGTLFRAMVLRDLWEWFVVPLGMPGIGMAHAVGISTIVGFLTYQAKDRDKDNDSDDLADGVYALILSIVVILFSWGIGAVAHSYM